MQRLLMNTRSVVSLVLLAACGPNWTESVASISVTVSPPTANVPMSGSLVFTATVKNDPSNSGVAWSITGCSGGPGVCGSLSNVTSTQASYAAPATVPRRSLGVAATSVSDSTKASTATVAVSAPSDEARAELRYYIERVAGATAHRYRVFDDASHTMDGLKIIANPAVGGFIGVYQTSRAGTFDAHLATSSDLLHWTWRVVLDRSAAQPTIKAAGAGFVVVTETDGDNHLRFYYYDSWQALLTATASRTYDAPRTLSPCAEGTPNIYAGDSTRVEVGFHYWSQCDVGRQARGVTDWSSWSAAPEPLLDSAITAYGIAGVGDRDGPFTFRGYQFAVIEGERVRNQWDSWRIFLYDYQTRTADQLNIQTDARSISFGNPTIEEVEIGGRRALIVTLFIFLDGSAAGEDGSLVYYSILP